MNPSCSQELRARGLRPAAELAAQRAHGDRLRYLAGCRCADCRRANTQYESVRAAARKAGDWNGIVPALRAQAHIAALSKAGVGRRQVADAAGVSESVIGMIIGGTRKNIRARAERAILAVTPQAAADRALIDAAPTWKLIDALLSWGYTKAHLARELGYERAALQLNRNQCTARNAHEVQKLHARLRRVPYEKTARLIADLRDEGYRQQRIEEMVLELAARDGQPAPDLTVHRGFISAAAAALFQRLHEEVMEVPA